MTKKHLVKKERKRKKIWSCEVFGMNLLIKCSYERNSSILPHVPLWLFITACFVLHIYSGHLNLPHHEHWVENKKYNDDDRMKQLPASNKDKVLNEDKPLHMNTDAAFFYYKVGFFSALWWVWFLCQWEKTRKDIQRKKSTRCMWIGVNTSHKRTHKKRNQWMDKWQGKKSYSNFFFP